MDISINVNLWFLISLCLFCLLAGLIYGVAVRKRIEQEQLRQYDKDRRYY
jgi:uncharacterized protein YneF (UPF0154 family)